MIQSSQRRYHGDRRLWNGRLAALLAWAFSVALACEPSAPEPAPAPPPRIVALGPELVAVLVELGVGPAVVGVDSPSLVLPGLAHAIDLGAPTAPSPERAIGARPELALVLAMPSQPGAAFAEALEVARVPTYVFAPRDANEVIAAIHRIGRLVGKELPATALAARLTREVSEIATRRDGRRRLSVAWILERDPLVVVGASGLLHEVLELAGAENAVHAPEGDRLEITREALAAAAPDVVLAPAPADPVLPGAKHTAIDPALAALPLLDLPARVRELHAVLYPGGGGGNRTRRPAPQLLESLGLGPLRR